jgi:hypothetical protein
MEHKDPPPILSYSTPPPGKTTVGVFLLRMLVGCVLSFICGGLGILLARYSGVPALVFLPIGVLTIAAIVLTVTRKTFGYLTGIALSLVLGVLIGVALFVLLLVTCFRSLGKT